MAPEPTPQQAPTPAGAGSHLGFLFDPQTRRSGRSHSGNAGEPYAESRIVVSE
jgi:hypothetical protein